MFRTRIDRSKDADYGQSRRLEFIPKHNRSFLSGLYQFGRLEEKPTNSGIFLRPYREKLVR